jgi:glutaredoxin 3
MEQAAKIEMYCTGTCPYCHFARQLLDKKGVEYTEYYIDQERHLREEMEGRSSGTSVPQIFIDGKHIGGFEDMAELDMDGELDSLLGLVKD